MKDQQIKISYQVSISSIECFAEQDLKSARKGKKWEKYKEVVFDGRVEARLTALRCSQSANGYAQAMLIEVCDC